MRPNYITALPPSPVVRLTDIEYKLVYELAKDRIRDSRQRGLRDRLVDGVDGDEKLDREMIGACGEFAIAKHYRLYPRPDNTFGVCDVGYMAVRSTWRSDGSLVIRDRDMDKIGHGGNVWFVLVTGQRNSGQPPTMTLRGGLGPRMSTFARSGGGSTRTRCGLARPPVGAGMGWSA